MNLTRPPLIFYLFITFLTTPAAFSQTTTYGRIEKAIAAHDAATADSLLRKQLDRFFAARLADSLPVYTMYVGKVAEMQGGAETAIKKMQAFIDRVKSLSPGNLLLAKITSEAGEYYGSIGKNKLAYTTNQLAQQYALQSTGVPAEMMGSINSDMGTFAYRMGDVDLAGQHHRKAIAIFLAAKNPDNEQLYVAANNMGSIMWFASRLDSAIYYYNMALAALAKTERTPINQYYRPAVLENNMTAIYNQQGETTRAIAAMKSCIDNLKKYLAIPESVPKKPNTVSFQFEATDNLAGIYKELGDYATAEQLLQYSYRQKQKDKQDRTGVFKSQILLGQLYLALKEHDKALGYLQEGLAGIAKADGDFLFWQADACNSLALLYDEKKDKQQAARYFAKGDSLYEASLAGEYDDIYLEFLRNAALFYAENNQLPVALQKANKGFEYVKKTQGAQTLLAFYQLLNLAEVYLNAGNYRQALDYSRKGLAVVDNMLGRSANRLDSVKTELQKPKAILLKTKAEYYLLPAKTVGNLSALLTQLDSALVILEKRKTLIHESKDVGLLLSAHNDLLDFDKKLILELYRLTNDAGYIDRLLNIHESALYNRIRSRLDKNDSIRFAGVPASVQQQERQLKSAIRASLAKQGQHADNMTAYFNATQAWNDFLQQVKTTYPQYYTMRYASIFQSLDAVQQTVPANTTLVRYLFLEKELVAVVIDRKQKQLFLLDASNTDRSIEVLTNYSSDVFATSHALTRLYDQLWKPLAPLVQTSKVVIIPDGILYNLSFEMLTAQPVSNYGQLATHSLLAKHAISYQYSLALGMHQPGARVDARDNFVAFAPGFLDADKQRYRSAIKDSSQIDMGYVSLLPQPFTLDFVDKAQDMLGGKTYTSEASTAAAFKNSAGDHTIIHIGTHAESNNLSPEYSRLIFSKSGAGDEYNSVFLYDIYNCDLGSELAVLTACESGKPGYQDGEGMISLAHAFNYAGSKSIVTGLWKIDEEASTLLMETFYKNLLAGMDKDEALRQAKLSYLQTAKGRMLAPQYWAGLVLVGDNGAIQINKNNRYFWWWIAGALAAAGAVIVVVGRKRSRRETV